MIFRLASAAHVKWTFAFGTGGVCGFVHDTTTEVVIVIGSVLWLSSFDLQLGIRVLAMAFSLTIANYDLFQRGSSTGPCRRLGL